VALVENGTHVLFGARPGGFAEGETTLAHDVLEALGPGMLCLADRQFFGHALWREAAATGADLLWRVKRNLRLPRETVLADGSFLSTIYPSEKDRRHASGCGWSSTGWRAWPTPSRSTGWSPPCSTRPPLPRRSWPRSTTSGGRSRARWPS
jgi:hypothetical protein